MGKISLIAKREFLSRVRKKTFLVTTILLPTLIFGLYALIIYFSVKGPSDTVVAISDNAHYFQDSLKSDPPIYFKSMPGLDKPHLDALLSKNKIGAYVLIPSGMDSNAVLNIVSQKSLALKTKQSISEAVNVVVKKQKMQDYHLTPDDIQKVNTPATIKYESAESGEDSMAKSGIAYGVGMVSGMIIYIVLLLYGMAVMRGVMEEKVSRIAEVIISSVKPFQLMMGKILGIGAVGLLQFLIWIVLTIVLRMVLIPMLFPSMANSVQSSIGDGDNMQSVMALLSTINFPLLIGCFLIYFLGGYLIYASLFAAVGSAVNEDPQEAQSFSFPVTMPIIFSVIIMMQAVNEPQSGLAIFGSLFPLTSPVVMMARIAQGVPDVVPYWQLGLSILLLILGFLLTTWFAAKVYRTGILMYGKKPTLKEIIKWARNKG